LAIEYLITARTLAVPVIVVKILRDEFDKSGEKPKSLMERFDEPRRSVLVAKLAFSNWLSQCDRPRPHRTSTTPGVLGLFLPATGDASPKPGSTPDEIEGLLERTALAKAMLPGCRLYMIAIDREVAKEGLLEIVLALQQFYREHGMFPATTEPLVGKYLDQIPVDPFGHGEPLRYRLEPDLTEGATLWSVGPDCIDDDGRIDFLKSKDHAGDMIVRARTPREFTKQ
jgi:hypothetical protein